MSGQSKKSNGIANSQKTSSIFASDGYPDPAARKESKKQADADYAKISDRGKNSGIFATSEKVTDTRASKIEGSSPKTFVKNQGKSDAEKALYDANKNSVKTALEVREQSKAKATSCVADQALFDKANVKQTFETEQMKNLAISSDTFNQTGPEAKAGRSAMAAKQKGSSVFGGDREDKGVKRGMAKVGKVNMEDYKAPKGEVNEEAASVSAQARADREAQRARGLGSEVFAAGGGAYADDSKGSNAKTAGKPMSTPVGTTADQAINQAENRAKKQALLAGGGKEVEAKAAKGGDAAAKRQELLKGSGSLW